MKLNKEQKALLAGLGMYWEKSGNDGWHIVRLLEDKHNVVKAFYYIEWNKEFGKYVFGGTDQIRIWLDTFDEVYQRAKTAILQFEQDNFEEIKAHWQGKGWEYVEDCTGKYYKKKHSVVYAGKVKLGWFVYRPATEILGELYVHSINERLRRAEQYIQSLELLNL